MARYIDADDLSRRMYHEAFEVDSDMQKWDSGCWIRYKVFENCIAATPTADVVEVVRCKDCKNWRPEAKPYSICDLSELHAEEDDFCSDGCNEEMKGEKDVRKSD